jgi:hypothetical protein
MITVADIASRLVTAAVRKLPVTKVMRMSEPQVYRWLKRARLPKTNGEPWCAVRVTTQTRGLSVPS